MINLFVSVNLELNAYKNNRNYSRFQNKMHVSILLKNFRSKQDGDLWFLPLERVHEAASRPIRKHLSKLA